jgi:hypothetical protein
VSKSRDNELQIRLHHQGQRHGMNGESAAGPCDYLQATRA